MNDSAGIPDDHPLHDRASAGSYPAWMPPVETEFPIILPDGTLGGWATAGDPVEVDEPEGPRDWSFELREPGQEAFALTEQMSDALGAAAETTAAFRQTVRAATVSARAAEAAIRAAHDTGIPADVLASVLDLSREGVEGVLAGQTLLPEVG